MSHKSLKILLYNTCYGLLANTPWKAYNATWNIVHKRRDPIEINQKSNFDEVYEMIHTHNPDIVILHEIFDNLQTIPIKNKLKELWFSYIFIGNSGHHDTPLNVSTLIATTFPCTPEKIPFRFKKNTPGTGGGVVGIHIKKIDVFFLWFHSAFLDSYLQKQIWELDWFFRVIKNKYSNIIFAWDFNRSIEYYKNHSSFIHDMKLLKSSSTFPSFFCFYKPLQYFFKNIVSGQIDCIFYRWNLQAISSQVLKKRSDHKAVVAKLEVKIK